MATEMPLHTVYDTATIRAVTQECQQEFRTCAEVPALTEKHWAENRLADFNLWGAWVGASAEEPNSLELHLYHDSEAQKVVISTLSILIAWLRKCKEVAETQRTGSQPPAAASDSNAIPTRTNTSDGHETPIGLQEAKKSVGDILAALIDLGIAIGHDVGGVPSRFTAADRALEEQADGSLYLELTEHLKFVLSSAKIPRIATRSNEALMRRTSYQELAVPKSWAVVGDVSHEQLILLKANIKRHNRFVYAQKRERPNLGLQKIKDDTILLPEQLAETAAVKLQMAGSPTIIARQSDYPPAPESGDDAKPLVCPYCRSNLSTCKISEDQWRKHLSNDIQPYTCYLSECIQENPMFNEFQAWKDHVVNDHQSFRGWSCPLCRPRTDFRDETDLHDHIRRAHAQVTTEDYSIDLPSISKMYSAPEFNVCPVCSMREVEWETKKQEPGEADTATERTSTDISHWSGRTFLDHIGSCMHAFALRSLPAAVRDFDNNEFDSHRSICCTTEKSTPSTSSRLLELPTSSSHESKNSLTVINLQSALPSGMILNIEDWITQSNSAMDDPPSAQSLKGVCSDAPKKGLSLVQPTKRRSLESVKTTSSELRGFFEHLDDCTASAVVESQPLVTRPIVSVNSLRSWFTTERARRLLLYVESDPSYEDAVQTSHLAVFSVLLSIDMGIYLSTFIRRDHMADAGLPFLTCDAWPDAIQHIFEEFYKAQWKFCPRRLDSHQLHDTWLHENMVVPLKHRVPLREGADATISKVELFEEYNHLITDELNIPPTNFFILKSSPSDYAKLHNNEVEAYRTLLSYPSGRDAMQYMARFYGSWRQGESCIILREYVGGGTLTEFFKRTEPPTTKVDILEFWKNFIQFIKPIACIHRLPDPHNPYSYKVGLHNDIKPDKILVSDQDGDSPYSVSFKLADLGLAGFVVADESDPTQIRDVRGTKMYSAPEYFRGETDRSRQQSIKQVGPAKDVWALACVISEASVWSVLGQRGLDDYHHQRVQAADAIPNIMNTGYSGCFHDTTKVLSVVGNMHKEVNQRFRTAMDNVVGSVLLIVSRMMVQDPARRPDARTVYDDLTQAIDLATPFALAPESARHRHSPHDYNEYSMPITSPPNQAAGLGLDINELSLHSGNDVQVLRSPRPSGRRLAIEPHFSFPLSRTSSVERAKLPIHDPYSLAPDTKHESQWTSLAPISGPVPRYRAPVGSSARPKASITEILAYITKKKTWPRTILPGGESFKRLGGRDQIFLVDDSQSMRPCWKEVQNVFAALAYLVKSLTPDGIELHFANSPERKGRSKDRKSLIRKFEMVKPYGQSQMGIALSNILPPYYQNQQQSAASKRFSFAPRVEEKPSVNIYILTDGVWSPGSYSVTTIQDHIKNLTKNLWKAGKLQHVGIQFIRFGNDALGKQRLEYLDNDNLQHYTVPMDIVDTEPSTGNVFKMILASTDPSWDNDDDKPSG